MLLNTFLSIIALFATSNASPTNKPQSFIVYAPHIISPNASTEWRAGTTHNVTWDVSCVPPEKQNDTGRIVLGYKGNTTSENLDVEHPLCTGFPIARGYANVTMPSTVKPRHDYFIVRERVSDVHGYQTLIVLGGAIPPRGAA